VRLSRCERRLLLGSEDNANVLSWRDALIDKMRINWRSTASGRSCVDALRIDKLLHSTVRKVDGQRFIVSLLLTTSSSEEGEGGEGGLGGEMKVRLTMVQSEQSLRFSMTMDRLQVLKVLSYKDTWRKIVESMSAFAERRQIDAEVRHIVQNARGEWSTRPETETESAAEDAAFSEEQLGRALESKTCRMLIVNQVCGSLKAHFVQKNLEGYRSTIPDFDFVFLRPYSFHLDKGEQLRTSLRHIPRLAPKTSRPHDGSLDAVLRSRRSMPAVDLEKVPLTNSIGLALSLSLSLSPLIGAG
jgi:hypothetical protein